MPVEQCPMRDDTRISTHVGLVPFLKWAGGKRWLARNHRNLFPGNIKGVYYEPFLGGASVFATLNPGKAILSDLNEELINAYIQVRNHWKRVEEGLAIMQERHSREFFYAVRGASDGTDFQRGLRFIYLNRTCFNGIYRVNRRGAFNVPIGTKDSVLLDNDDFRSWSAALKRCNIFAADFEQAIERAGKGDFIFADPPYTVLHNKNCFLKYNECLFSWEDQERLAEALYKASLRGATVFATNANHDSIRKLYRGRFALTTLSRSSTMAASVKRRGSYEEIIIRSKEG